MILEEAVIVVTGGGNGIGEALARRFAQEQPRRICIADLAGDRASAVAKDIEALSYQVDVADPKAVANLVERVEARAGPIDLFCSNAGIAEPGGPELSDELWERSWKVNVMAHVAAARALVPRMIERGGGHFLATASAAGLLAQLGSAPYSVTKHAAIAFAEWLSISFGAKGIGVSVLCPQGVGTRMLDDEAAARVAGIDGILTPAEVADVTVRGLRRDDFLILPHKKVAGYYVQKASEPQAWIRGMQFLQDSLGIDPSGGLATEKGGDHERRS